MWRVSRVVYSTTLATWGLLGGVGNQLSPF